MRKLNRREFLRNIGLGSAGLTLFAAPAAASEVQTAANGNLAAKLTKLKETFTVCSYCGCGCGILLYSDGERIVFAEGDPDHPINEGTLCPKGNGIIDVYNVVNRKHKRRIINPRRITKPLYRAPGAAQWQEISWDEALARIAKRIKKTRDETFEEKDKNGITVNRTTAIGALGSASLDNEENYLLHKMFRALGIINMEHHARL
ncbi:formate dehydrogenase major subunit [Desulfohalotomaculum tongense]|nr:formate dehydrogenase major subunit [Desulforadius tongensis]